MLKKINLERLSGKRVILLILITIAVAVGAQKYLNGPGHYNNYLIFKNAFLHLAGGLDLYVLHEGENTDYYLYSPSFAVLMAPFAYMPDWAGVILWCLVNSLAVYFVITRFPFSDSRSRAVVLLLIFFEFITSQQNLQTNPIVASLIVLAFISFEKEKVFLAALFIMLSFYIKIYGIAAAVLFLLYPGKPRFILSMIFWGVLLWMLPLLFVSFDGLLNLYKSWYGVTSSFHENSATRMTSSVSSEELALSVMNWLKIWFRIDLPALYVQIGGTLLMLLPFIRTGLYNNKSFRVLLLSSVLIWGVIFNHIAESASYMVAIMGAAIWFAEQEKRREVIVLIVLAFIFTSLSPTDLFPRYLRIHLVKPYLLKGVPCMIIWFYIQYQLLASKGTSLAGGNETALSR
jgi:hypothetical protein